MCSVHPGEPAVLQNVHSKSYHCDEDCFAQSWREWMRHRMANGGRDENAREPLWKPPHLKDQPGGGAPPSPHGSSTNLSDNYHRPKNAHRGGAGHNDHGSKPDEPETWTEVGRAKCYSATAEDVGHLLTYNVLADLYATSEMYSYTPSWALAWNYRRQNILKEIVQHDADILCLQEVQSDHFEDFFQGELGKHGYTAVYKKKTAQVFSQGTYVIDGCAIFFKKDRFTLIKKYEVEFNKAALSLVESLGGSSQKKEALNRLMKDNVALIVVLEALDQPGARDPNGKRQLLCVANTHIHANTELNDVKLWQVFPC